MPSPAVTVILATYNLSTALPCTIRSALAQTFGDFELLVIGDACTDDSEAVVRSFDDSRVQWFNLPERRGSQYGPNNAGLERARGEYIAYLGHDDLWWPEHLEVGLRTLADTAADMAVAVAIINGPPSSGFKGVTGLFPNDVYTPRYDFSPSSMIHRRAIVERAGPWRSPRDAEIGVDHDFVTRCHRAGARIVSTNELTVFKFNTSYRRNAYRTRSVDDHEAMFERMQRGGEAFRRAELITTLHRFFEDRFFRIEGVWDEAERATVDSVRRARQFLRFKGAGETIEKPVLGTEPLRWSLGDEYSGFEWHEPEHDHVHGEFRWTGPSTESAIALPVTLDRPCRATLHILFTLDTDLLATLIVEVDSRPVPTTLARTDAGTWLLAFPIEPRDGVRDCEIVLRVARTIRPFDVSPSMDRRWLGVAVNWVELTDERNAGT
jgi:glycosyltransferase involved in cell wall biosynthesis